MKTLTRQAAGRAVLGVVVLAAGVLAGCAAQPRDQAANVASSRPGSALANEAPGVGYSLAPRASGATRATHHYEYVFPDGAMFVYDIDRGERLVQQVSLAGVSGIRGVGAIPRTHMLYISHGGDGGENSHGSLLAYDLLTDRIVWDRHYNRGIDSFAISPDGSKIYMPDGELSSDGTWTVLDAGSGDVVGQISGGRGPHNTIVGPSGRQVYLGGRNYPYLDIASTSTNRVIRRVGPLMSGVRPFTINGRETLAYTTATGFLGFQVSSIVTGRVLYTETFGSRFGWDPATFPASAPSHGISLAPNERQLWVLDAPNNYVHVFDVSRLPRRSPRHVADIRLAHPLTGAELGCSYDCARDGWLQHSRSGCFVFVGDSGDVLSTRSFRVVAFLPALRNTRKFLEIDWRGGVPFATSSRSGIGSVTRGRRPAPPRCR